MAKAIAMKKQSIAKSKRFSFSGPLGNLSIMFAFQSHKIAKMVDRTIFTIFLVKSFSQYHKMAMHTVMAINRTQCMVLPYFQYQISSSSNNFSSFNCLNTSFVSFGYDYMKSIAYVNMIS
jgi:hypothetical protein